MSNNECVRIDPSPLFELSPNLYMQFMEPLGTTDSSVEAAWDFQRDCWREDVLAAVSQLNPPLIRWGGCLSSYYRWREGVGPRAKRVPMFNLLWGGVETNQIGTHEFIDFCRQVGAEPFFNVNFESDGRSRWAEPKKGGLRSAGPEEAAEWVDYCNNPSNTERVKNGAKEPFDLRLWQIGNETSYDPSGYDVETAAKRTLAFARAMRERDPRIELIGWGDSGWARRMLEVAGEHLKYLSFHHMLRPKVDEDSPLKGIESPIDGFEYRRDPAKTWDYLMRIHEIAQTKINRIREQIAGYEVYLTKTEGHFAISGRNRGEVLSTWAAGVANARILNVHERNGDLLKIATQADFFGNRWLVNAIILPTPQHPGGSKPYLMPVARVMQLYRRHMGDAAVTVKSYPPDLDIVAARTGNKIFLHVINTSFDRAVKTSVYIRGMKVRSGRVFEIACDPMCEIDESQPGLFSPVERSMSGDGTLSFPAASVSALELEIEEQNT